MDEHAIVRSMLLRVADGVPASAPLVKAVLEWPQPHSEWLVPGHDEELTWASLLGGVAEPRAPSPRPQALEVTNALAELLAMTPFDAALLRLMVACDRLPRVGALARVASRLGHDLPALLGELAGAAPREADRAVRRSMPVRLDLASFVASRQGEVEVSIRWTLERLLDRAPVGGEALLGALVGRRQPATLCLADAFAEARQRDAVLLFDEADSLLFDRSTARTSWEVGQVNELLTWLDRHPLPVIAATNHEYRLDPATLRRFVFKVRLAPLGRTLAARAFARFFGVPAPASLAEIRGLTPGDFAVVARQLRFVPAEGPGDLIERLRLETAAKPSASAKIGF